MNKQTGTRLDHLMLVLGTVLGLGSIVAFWVFLYTGPLGLFKTAHSHAAILRVDAFLSALFFVQHSFMIRKTFRELLGGMCPKHYYGVIFSIFSGVILFSVVLFWQSSPVTLFSAQGSVRWAFRALYFLCIAGFAWCIWVLGSLDPFGLQAIRDHVTGTKHAPQAFIVRGPYRWVRHPVYFIWLVLFWACPDLTVDRVMLNVFWSLWIFAAAHFEERDLSRNFGEAFQQYRKEVPMLFPRTLRPIR